MARFSRFRGFWDRRREQTVTSADGNAPSPPLSLVAGDDSVSLWRSALDVVDHRTLPPDPDVLMAIGLSHAMTSALADLVDNSIDAGATAVFIRFIRSGSDLRSLIIADDGQGMDGPAIDSAMTVGRRRDYQNSSLGHFGMGMKAASFSQANVLTVMSVQHGGRGEGRRWTKGAAVGFTCDVIDPLQAAESVFAFAFAAERGSGTVVRWDDVRAFPAARDPQVAADYIARTISDLRTHLGLVFQRIIERGQIEIAIDVFDVAANEAGPPVLVDAIDPFGYRHSGVVGYPRRLEATVDGRPIPVICHIWPARSSALGFRFDESPEQRQGFFFYRHDRLLEAGGWKGAVTPNRRLQLARVSVDINEVLDLFTMNMEKTSVHPNHQFIRAVESAIAKDGTTFRAFLADAEEAYRLGNQRNTSRQEVLPPGAGIAPEVKQAIARELPFVGGRSPLEIRWKTFLTEDFFEVDRHHQVLWLNVKYRNALLVGRRGSLNDLPVLKTLLYLLTEDVFRSPSHGPRDKDNVEIWQAALTAAVKAECDGI